METILNTVNLILAGFGSGCIFFYVILLGAAKDAVKKGYDGVFIDVNGYGHKCKYYDYDKEIK